MGPWRLDSPLGRGAQGRTYRATHVETGATAALKILNVQELADWKPYDLFDREKAALQALSHPGIPYFLDAGTTEGQRWIAMQLMAGQPLSERLRHGQPLSLDRTADLLDQALDVLAYLHGLSPPVIHRDLKPSNLIVSDHDRLAIVDFGSVRTAFRADGGSTMAGTFGYLAPEQLHGEATAKTDLFSLGVAFAALAAGLEGQNLPRKGLRVDLDRLLPDGPLKSTLAAMTEPDPDLRPASAAAARQMLRASSAAHTSAAPTGSDVAHKPPSSGNPISVIFWLVIALLAAVAAATFKLVTHVVTNSQDRQRKRIEDKTRKELARLDAKHGRQRASLSKFQDSLSKLQNKANERGNLKPQSRPPRNPPRR
jgi:serine/threonine protein kinase